MTNSDPDKLAEAEKPARPSAASLGALVAAPLLLVAGLWFAFSGNDGGGNRASSSPMLVGGSVAEFPPEQRKAIEGIVKDYLIQNPEIFLEVQSALEAKMAKDEADRTKAMVAEHAKEIYRAPNAPVAGNPDGDITVVEFFDYNCGYCKRGFSEIAKLVEQDKNVRVVFKEFPILRDESEQAARVALAARMQGKYWEVHRDMISAKGLVNEAVALKVAEAHGLDMAKLKVDMASPEVKAELDRVKELARKLSINGTPHFLVGDRAIGGAPDNLYDVLEAHVTELRKSGCNYC
jgi:protein-disulfide isomerase